MGDAKCIFFETNCLPYRVLNTGKISKKRVKWTNVRVFY